MNFEHRNEHRKKDDFLENEQSGNEESDSEEEFDKVDELTLDDIGKLLKVETFGG